ncbi:MAG TPA: insulinase family protein [Candidatus Kapabacteria bacterium]|nr:insulinase family protein [Candidatus Kapabacteria bacterium]
MSKLKLILLACIAVILLGSNVSAQSVAGYDLSQAIPMKKAVKTGKLPNGLTYFVLENHKPENRAELQIVINAGSVMEDRDQSGLAHFIEHMCFNGTKNFPENELISFLESTGMRFGADVNASTGFDRTYYTLTIPLDKPGLLDKGVQVLRDWLDFTTFDSTEIEKERGVIIEEWRMRGNADMRTFMKHLPYIGYGSIYKDRLPIGDTAIILHAPKERFTTFYNDFYRPEISAIIAVGDFNGKDVEKLIIEKFSDAGKAGKMPPLPNMTVPYNHPPMVSIATDAELQMPNISVMYKHAPETRGTYGEYRNNLIENIYNTVLNFRLQELSRKATPPFLYAGGGYSGGFLGKTNLLTLVVVPKSDNIMGGYESLLTEAFRIHKHGITKSEMERAKVEMLSGMESAFKEKDKVESMSQAQELYRHFYEGESVPGIDKEFELTKAFLPTITLEEMNQFAKGLIRDEGMVITASIPQKDGIKVPTEQDLTSTYRKIESSSIEAYKDVDTDKPLVSNLPNPGSIKSKKEIKDIGATELELSNGIKVYLKHTDFKNEEINMTAQSWGGTSTASDKDYFSASAASGIINSSGVGEFDETTLEKILTGKQVSVSPYIGELSQGMRGTSTPKDLETFFQLVYLYFTAPRKDTDAYESMKSKLIDQIANSGMDPVSVFRDSVTAIMGGYNLRKMPWTEEAVEKVNLDNAFNFYKSKFGNAGNFTFTFVGNFKMEEIEKYLKQYIATLPKGKTDKWKDLGIKGPKGALKKIVYKGFEPKSQVRLTIDGDFDYNRVNRFELSAMMEVLSIRLREVIREDKGGVYGIGARPSYEKYPKPTYTVNIGFGTDPKRAEELADDCKGVINDVKAGKFDESYIEKVQAILSREYETNQKENRYWMGVITQYLSNGEPFSQVNDTPELISKITKKSIVDAANKYLNTKVIKEFLLMPEE